MSERTIIGGGGGFWGDQTMAPLKLLESADLDYLTMDYLSEVTMSIMHKQLNRNSEAGWATDLKDWLKVGGIGLLRSKTVKLVTNAGGANPHSCASMVLAAASEIGWNDCKVALVIGDDLGEKLSEIAASGAQFTHMYNPSLGSLLDRSSSVVSANAYLGAGAIGRSLERGADIVITGRVADASLIVGCMLHSKGWAKRAEEANLPLCGPIANWGDGNLKESLDIIAGWTVAGHLIECGAQVSGGNSTDWNDIGPLTDVGYPIAEVYSDGRCIITKPNESQGAVTSRTVAEQLLYEIGDPCAYITPDCIVDFSSILLEEIDKDRILVHGAKGIEQTATMKLSASHRDGWMVVSELVAPGPNARKRAESTDFTLRSRLKHLKGMEIHSEYLGDEALIPPALRSNTKNPSEIVIRWVATSMDKNELMEFSRAIAPLVLTGPAGICGYSARARPREILRFFPTLLDRNLVEPQVHIKMMHSWRHDLELRMPWSSDLLFIRLENMAHSEKNMRRSRFAEKILRRLDKATECEFINE